MKKLLSGLLGKNQVTESKKRGATPNLATRCDSENITQKIANIDNLIKMREAMALIKASAPTVRKYARLGYYSEYRFGEKLVFYNKQEMLNFILSGQKSQR